ncbi:MAG: SPOR domain-containing protein, partial [Anaerolineae bacterium]
TATMTPLPTATDVPLPTASDTPLPTATDVPPTATNTPEPPTATVAPSATPTSVPNDLVYVSSSTGGSVDGVPFRDEDILVYDTDAESWAMYFDGSDVGLGGTDVDAFAFASDGDLLLSFSGPISIDGLGTVGDADLVLFEPSSTGDDTAGSFYWFFDGSDVGFDSSGEDIDALALDDDGDLLLSTKSDFDVPGLVGEDEDLVRFEPTQLGAETAGDWHAYFDGSDVELEGRSEDAYGCWRDPSNGDLYLTALGDFSVTGSSGDASDAFVCHPETLGANTECTYGPGLFWNGSGHGFGGENVDALAVRR